MDDIEEWCRTDVHILSIIAQDRSKWRRIVTEALYTNGGQAHGMKLKKHIA